LPGTGQSFNAFEDPQARREELKRSAITFLPKPVDEVFSEAIEEA
jgi:hypothetical protein